MITGGKLIYQQLLKNNVKNAFIYSGGSIMSVIDEFYKGPIKYYINTHEQNTGHSATGYAKTTNRTGVCIVTSGPGITNMITPMLDATNDSTPLVVISGQVAQSAMGTNAFQEAPAVSITKPVTKWSYQLEKIEDIPFVIDTAFTIANNGKKGSVHIDVPKDISSGMVDYDEILESPISISTIPKSVVPIPISKKNMAYSIVSKINKSKKPIIYVGQGCKNASSLLRDFAIYGNIPVTSTIHGKGIFDEHHPLSLQWCGMHGYAPANYMLQEADCIIAIGSRFDDRTTGLLSEYAPIAKKKKGIIHINIEPSEINKVVAADYSITNSCEKFLTYAIPKIQYQERRKWMDTMKKYKKKYPFLKKKSSIIENELCMEHVLDMLYKKTINKDVIFTTGVGNHQMQAYQFIKAQYPNKIISSGSLGVMGSGLPYAIGAQIANPEKMIITIDGDSSFNMTLSDLKTIAEYNLPIKIAIMNNNAQMMVNIWEKLFYNKRYTATINHCNPSYTSLADSYNIMSLSCNNISTLESTINDFIAYDGPILCEFAIKKDICLPLVGPGKKLDDMILPNSQKEIKFTGGEAPS